MADVAFGAVNLVLGLIQDEARLLGGIREDLRFIMQEMESMNNVLRHIVANKGSAAASDYQLRPWMKQVLELAFDSRNCVELYTQSGSGRCGWLPWVMVARHRIVTRIHELKIRAREISERQARYGIAVSSHPQPINMSMTMEPMGDSVHNQRRPGVYAGSSNNPSRRAILDDRWFGDYSSVDEVLSRLKPFTEYCYREEKPPALLNDDDKQQPRLQLVSGNKHDDKGQLPPPLDDRWFGDYKEDEILSRLKPLSEYSCPEVKLPVQLTEDNKQQSCLQLDGGDKHDDNEQMLPPQSDGGDKGQQSDGENKEKLPPPHLGGCIKLKQLVQSDDNAKQPPPPQSDGSSKHDDKGQPPPTQSGVKQQSPQSDDNGRQPPLALPDGDNKHDDKEKEQPQLPQTDGVKLQPPPLVQPDGGFKLELPPPQLDSGFKLSSPVEKKQHIRVAAICVQDGTDESVVGETVLERYKSHWRRPWSQLLHVYVHRPPILSEITKVIVDKLRDTADRETDNELEDRNMLAKKLVNSEVLLVLSGLNYPVLWHQVLELLSSTGCPESAVILCTNDSKMAKYCCDSAKDRPPVIYSLVDIYLNRALALLPCRYDEGHLKGILHNILAQCCPDVFCMKMLLHALYYNADTTEHQLEVLKISLGKESTDHGRQDRIMAFCYQALPNNYKNCLWYSTVFTRGITMPDGVRRASLLRRWVAQGLITQVEHSSAEDEAEHCFEAMIRQKLIVPSGFSGARKVKSCIVHPVVADLIDRESSTVEDLLLNNQLPLDLDLLYSIRNGMQLHPANSNITRFLNSLSSTSRLLLTVLDLEGRKGLKAHDIHTVCKIHKLKYLSLRNTDVAQLPKQIGQLKLLETLDIRGTRVHVFHTVLPMLKHLLAGCTIDCPVEDIVKSNESFSTVYMPHAVASMEKMEILSRVNVSNSAKDLSDIGDKLKHLKKLGVVLSGKKANLVDLFLQVDKLHRCLRSLSVRMDPPGNWDAIDVILLRPPKLLESLHICSIRHGLPPRIKELHHLAKITLRDTFLNQNALDVLSMLKGLRYLRLCYHSFAEGTLRFENFKNLMDLVIEDDIVTSITFGISTRNYQNPGRMLEKIVWSFTHMEKLSGVHTLESLTYLELNGGTCNPQNLEELKREVDDHSNRITFTLKST
uniref:Uncharacterized protein n=1 Tax=Leersia perrieri TaxID=77586 RepID=A0A0D9WZR4_9ORYZ